MNTMGSTKFCDMGKAILSAVGLMLLAFSISALSQQSAVGGELSKALNGVDWKKVSRPIASDPEFQNNVRNVFGALTPDAQRKVTTGLTSLKEGRGPMVTGTPVDAFVGRKLAKALSPFVADQESKDALHAFEENGNLQGLIEAVTGMKSASPAAEESKTAKLGAAPATASSHHAVEKVIVGGTWTWHSKNPGDANSIEFDAAGVGSHGGRGNIHWEATGNQEVTITHPKKGKAVIRVGADQRSFTGKGYDGQPVNGQRFR
jgi:hypothetical protein